jgi:hypothetical protein
VWDDKVLVGNKCLSLSTECTRQGVVCDDRGWFAKFLQMDARLVRSASANFSRPLEPKLRVLLAGARGGGDVV